jgi:hypothetical protein
MPTCTTCKNEFSEDEGCFSGTYTRKDGTRRGWFYCRPCRNSYMRAYKKKCTYNRRPDATESMKNRARVLARKHVPLEPCIVCGTTKRVQRHHHDYSVPLTVDFLCPKHHAQRHTTMMILKGCYWLAHDGSIESAAKPKGSDTADQSAKDGG